MMPGWAIFLLAFFGILSIFSFLGLLFIYKIMTLGIRANQQVSRQDLEMMKRLLDLETKTEKK